MKYDFSIQSKIAFMRECGITPNEYEVLIGVLMAQDEEYQDESINRTEIGRPSHVPNTEYLVFLQNTLTRSGLRQCLLSLQNKGLILKTCKLPNPDSATEGLKPNEVKFNKNVLKKYIKHSGEMFWELFQTYPSDTVINGRKVSLRTTFGNGGWSSLDEAASYYGQCIKYSSQTHKKILNLIEEAKDSDLLNMGLIKFLRGEEWNNLEDIINGTCKTEFK